MVKVSKPYEDISKESLTSSRISKVVGSELSMPLFDEEEKTEPHGLKPPEPSKTSRRQSYISRITGSDRYQQTHQSKKSSIIESMLSHQ